MLNLQNLGGEKIKNNKNNNNNNLTNLIQVYN